MSTKNRINVNFSVDLPAGVTARRIARWLLPTPGNALFTMLVIGVVIWAQMAGAAPWARPVTQSVGASATTVNYQGKLADNDGAPLDGTYSMSFALYDAATEGDVVWGPEVHGAVAVSGGLFSVGLGSQTSGGIPTTTWNGDRYLEIAVNGETLSPRELIRSVPIAGMALTVPDGAITSEKLARRMHKIILSSDLPLPNIATYTDVLSLTIDLDRETLVTVHASIACFNVTDTLFIADVIVDENVIIRSDAKNKGGVGENSMMSTSVLLDSGQHQIKLRAYVGVYDSFVPGGDNRTQLVVIEG